MVLTGLVAGVVLGGGWAVYRHYRPAERPEKPPGRIARSYEWLLWKYLLLIFLPFWLPFKLLGWGWRWLNPGRRVLEQLQWPKIYRKGETYLVVANYSPPPKEGQAKLLGLLGAGVMIAYRLQTRPDWQLPYVGVGVILWPALCAGIFVYILARFQRRELRLTVGRDGIRWRNAAWRRCRVPPEDMEGATLEVLERHSRAADEQDTDQLRRKPSYPVYRIASEVVMHSGFGLRDTQQVAEIAKDRNGLKAKRLQTGVMAALIAFRQEDGGQAAGEAVAVITLD